MFAGLPPIADIRRNQAHPCFARRARSRASACGLVLAVGQRPQPRRSVPERLPFWQGNATLTK
jgi:hypothetical protein